MSLWASRSGTRDRVHDRAARVVTAPVRFYQACISPALPRRCRYYPTCSAYAVEAVRVHGALKGVLLAAWRLARCNPLTPGGVDHVPDPGRWRYHYPHDVPRFEIDQSAG
ncbi:membrane protein insertion efficiency factor YidD [Actinomyces israelii]|uniref:membrane protein insertion efficiency factor YidD n=1 Tax=Actinomyces israelii TaxID=1659 RepID=UPI002357B42E|nr:membrane protein insertion efficiency factor YidD [Actinomyces israelii]